MLFVRSFRQFTGARRALRLPLCGVPDGRGGAEGVAAGVLGDEPLHRVDPPHGRQSGKFLKSEVVLIYHGQGNQIPVIFGKNAFV